MLSTKVPHAPKVASMEYICPLYPERMIFFLAKDVFIDEELENNKFITKYQLNAKYRDYKFITKENLPKGYPLKNVDFDKEGRTIAVSIRAMHRVCCADLLTKSIHCMADKFIRWKVFDYDNQHGGLIKFMINDKQIPIKHKGRLSFTNRNGLINRIVNYDMQVLHVDSLWNLDMKAGLLVYYYEPNVKSISSVYIDSENATQFKIIF